MDQVQIGGKNYLAEINFKVILDFQKAVGYSLDKLQHSEDPLTDTLTMVHIALQDGSNRQGLTFDLSFDDFLRTIQADEIKPLMEFAVRAKFVQGFLNPEGKKKEPKKVKPSQ